METLVSFLGAVVFWLAVGSVVWMTAKYIETR
jgi:hypothetical protein